MKYMLTVDKTIKAVRKALKDETLGIHIPGEYRCSYTYRETNHCAIGCALSLKLLGYIRDGIEDSWINLNDLSVSEMTFELRTFIEVPKDQMEDLRKIQMIHDDVVQTKCSVATKVKMFTEKFEHFAAEYAKNHP